MTSIAAPETQPQIVEPGTVADLGLDPGVLLDITIKTLFYRGRMTRTELADGTIMEDELVFAGRAEWDGVVVDVDVLLTRSGDVLIGTAFLKGYLVQLDYKANTLRIEKAPS
jgi:hypothetical protein